MISCILICRQVINNPLFGGEMESALTILVLTEDCASKIDASLVPKPWELKVSRQVKLEAIVTKEGIGQ